MLINIIMKSSSKVLTPEQKYMQTATGAMAKPPNPEDLKFKTAVDGYVHLHPGSVTAKVVRSTIILLIISSTGDIMQYDVHVG